MADTLSRWGRHGEALPPTREAVDLYRDLAAANPAYLPDLAGALKNLEGRFFELDDPTSGEAAWRDTLSRLEPEHRAVLLVYRSGNAQDGQPEAAGWLADALNQAGDTPGLTNAIRDEARRQRQVNPAGFDQAWLAHTGAAIPPWAELDADLLDCARTWLATASFTDEHDHLAAHPELLDEATDPAVAEALLGVSQEERDRCQQLRATARRNGIEAAYRPLLLTDLARTFAAAPPSTQRELLQHRKEDLLDDMVAEVLPQLAGPDQDDPRIQRAQALLSLAADPTATDVLDEALQALDDPALFPPLLQRTARRATPDPLRPAAILARSTASSETEAATCLLYLAVAETVAGDGHHATEQLAALKVDPDERNAWINEIADLARTHPQVLPLIGALTAPPTNIDASSTTGPEPTPTEEP